MRCMLWLCASNLIEVARPERTLARHWSSASKSAIEVISMSEGSCIGWPFGICHVMSIAKARSLAILIHFSVFGESPFSGKSSR